MRFRHTSKAWLASRARAAHPSERVPASVLGAASGADMGDATGAGPDRRPQARRVPRMNTRIRSASLLASVLTPACDHQHNEELGVWWATASARAVHRSPSSKKEALEMGRTLGDRAGVAANLHDLAGTLAQLGEFSHARELATEGLAIRKALAKPLGIAHALDALWDVAFFEHDYGEARRLAEEIIAILEQHGPDTAEMAITRWGLSECLQCCGEKAEARHELRIALLLAQRLRLRQHVSGMLYTAAGLIALDDPAQAATLIGANETLLAESGFGLFDPTECEKVAEAVRDRLGDEAYKAAHARGAAGDIEDALTLAIASTEAESTWLASR
jgi:tetratricopeptide (TPR) repeat protein